MEKLIQVPVNKDEYWRILVEMLDFMTPFKKLDPRTKDILAELLYLNDKYKDLSDEDKNQLIFNANSKKKISERQKMSVDNINNKLTVLRRLGFIKVEGENNFLNKKYTDNLQQYDSLTFKFKTNV